MFWRKITETWFNVVMVIQCIGILFLAISVSEGGGALAFFMVLIGGGLLLLISASILGMFIEAVKHLENIEDMLKYRGNVTNNNVETGSSGPKYSNGGRLNLAEAASKMEPRNGNMWSCEKCGTLNSAGALFCKGCGTRK